MKQQKYYIFLQKQILLMIALSLLPGLVYVFLGWAFDALLSSLLWYLFLILISLYGWGLYKEFSLHKMSEGHLRHWYRKFTYFMYTIFTSWSIIFLVNVDHQEPSLHYIAIFTQLGASVVASTLLVSDKKLFVPILITLMFPLTIYFFMLNTWYGYVLSVFSVIFVSVLLYAAYNTHRLIKDNYFQAQHDFLTGLYNRRYFMDYMESLNERLAETKKVAYIYLVDLDHFKTINDSLGHEIGDQLLIKVSNRIAKFADQKYMLSRLSGDEFVLVSEDIIDTNQNKEQALDCAEELLDIIREPYTIGKHHLHISASIGLHQLNPSSLYNNNFIKEVDIAMYEAKKQGRDGVIVFNRELASKVERHLLIEQKLHKALSEGKIEVYYQPQFDRQLNLKGCEALLRWYDDELGAISPDEFIPIAENTGLILDLGHYLIKETCDVLHEWNAKKYELKSFSINISIRQLLDSAFLEEVTELIQEYMLVKDEEQKIYFEITEYVFSSDMKKVVLVMEGLRELGIKFSIDDFGTGYSSLSYLRQLPIDEVKIDKEFITHLEKSSNDKNMITTIISIAKNFNLHIVSEGVETRSQLDFLIDQGCDTFQGFYFDSAHSKDEFEEKYFGRALKAI